MPETWRGTARRFPLLPRPRPACGKLEDRVLQIGALARSATPTERPHQLARVAEVMNKTALVLSDCGSQALARDLCWRHFDLYPTTFRLDAATAKLALEPMVNLARLAVREGHPDRAHHLLERLTHTVLGGGAVRIEDRTLNLTHLLPSEPGRSELLTWLWSVHLAEGTRALVAAGSWDLALQHVQRHHGTGSRLLDGRQIAILASCHQRKPDVGLQLLQQTPTAAEPWENAVSACLTGICQIVGGPAVGDDELLGPAVAYLEQDPVPRLDLFHARLGLTVIEIAAALEQPPVISSRTLERLAATRDGYAARELLGHPQFAAMTPPRQLRALIDTAHAAGLGIGGVPAPHLAGLQRAVEAAERIAVQAFKEPTSAAAN